MKCGDKVEVRFQDDWYPGRITEDLGDQFTVKVLDKEYAFGNPKRIPRAEEWIRTPAKPVMERGTTWFMENLRYITAVTEMLNNSDLPVQTDFYIHVELREADSARVVGQWSDEIAGDAWYFEEVSDG